LHDAEGAARAAGYISQQVPLPLQVLTGLQTPLPPVLQLPESAADAADAAAVGRYGEELAYMYYLQHPDMQQVTSSASLGLQGLQSQPQLVVEWVNQHHESGLPFDLVVKDAASGAVVCFVEVNSSRDAARQFFKMSHHELHLQQSRGAGVIF
jgi:hypothetical protein